MNVLQWLVRVRVLDYEVEVAERHYREARERLTSTTPNYDGDNCTGTKDPHKLDRLAVLWGTVQEKREALDAARAEIEAAINKLTDTKEREALMYYYLCNLNWPDISRVMHYSIRQVLNIRRNALEHIETGVTNGNTESEQDR